MYQSRRSRCVSKNDCELLRNALCAAMDFSISDDAFLSTVMFYGSGVNKLRTHDNIFR